MREPSNAVRPQRGR